MRRIVLEQSWRAGVGHIGSALSIVEILVALYGHVLRVPTPEDPDRDRFILSKGHAALALYGALHLKGWINEAGLNTYCQNGSRLGVHPDHRVRGVDFSTGSLGHGLPIGVGAALAARQAGSNRRIYVLISDAECNCGSVWEAAMFAAHHRLISLFVVVDVNGQQAFGYTHEVLNLAPLDEKWRAFGWSVHHSDGHDVRELVCALMRSSDDGGRPVIVLARTTFGKGVSFMERQLEWHYRPLSDAQYRAAIGEVTAQER